MRVRQRGRLTVVVALLLMVAIELAALRAGGSAITVVLGGVAGIALVVALLRADAGRIGLYLAYGSAFTLTWNGWFVGPIRPGDALILMSLGLLVAADPATSVVAPPWWVKQLAFALIGVVLLTAAFPAGAEYVAQRVVLDAVGAPTDSFGADNVIGANISVAFRFMIAVVAIPVAYTAAALRDPRAVRRLSICFAIGTALSGAAAFIDHLGIASIGEILTGIPNISDRQLGFAYQPNFLASGLVLALPFACWLLLARDRTYQLIGGASLLFLVLGVYASGSRGGAATAVLTILISFLVLHRSRAHTPVIVLVAMTVVGTVFVVFPDLAAKILSVTRLSGNPNTTGSDTVRSLVADQGVDDFVYSPIHGIGLHVSTEASQVYLQELASGGLILFTAMALYNLGAMWAAYQQFRFDDLAPAIFASILSTLFLNIFEANLSDRYYYVPEAILVAMITMAARSGPPGLSAPVVSAPVVSAPVVSAPVVSAPDLLPSLSRSTKTEADT